MYQSEKLVSEPFLNGLRDADDNDDEDESDGPVTAHRRGGSKVNFWNRYAVAAHLLVLTAYSLVFSFLVWKNFRVLSCASEMLSLPARDAVHWELRPFTTKLVDNAFTGEPRPELEDAWHDLLKSTLKYFNFGAGEDTS